MTSLEKLIVLLQLPREALESPEVVASLRELISSDETSLQYYVHWSEFESNLCWVFSEDPAECSAVIQEIRRQWIWSRRLWGYGTLALGLLLAVVGFQIWSQSLLLAVPDLPISRVAAICDAPVPTAWGGARIKQRGVLRDGERLQAVEGRFLIHFDSGATAACTAPVDLEVINGWELFLRSGDVCVDVPERARGFQVKTPTVEIVDLGTLFGVQTAIDGETEVHVLKGHVEAKTRRTGPVEIRAGFSRTSRVEGTLEEAVPASPERFVTQLSSLAGIAETTGEIQVLFDPPQSVLSGELVTAGTAILFQEQRGLELPEPLPLNAALPGEYHQKQLPESATLPAGTVVAVYFLHAQSSQRGVVEGSIRFDRPIRGLVLQGAQLDATDELFGRSGVIYPSAHSADSVTGSRGAVYKEGTDRIEISPDRKTLSLRLSCSVAGNLLDQFRILVAVSN